MLGQSLLYLCYSGVSVVIFIIFQFQLLIHFSSTEKGAMFLFANNDRDVFEVSVFSEDCRSWLVDNSVQQGESAFCQRIQGVFGTVKFV